MSVNLRYRLSYIYMYSPTSCKQNNREWTIFFSFPEAHLTGVINNFFSLYLHLFIDCWSGEGVEGENGH